MSTEAKKDETPALDHDELPRKEAQTGCCGGAAPRGVDACCALDAQAKSAGSAGCGCAARSASRANPKKGCC
jgi:hypothetical protein